MDHQGLSSCCSPNLLCRVCSCLFFTLLKFRFNTRGLLLFFFLFFCRYFYNRLFSLQELTWVETLVKILYFTRPQVPKHFHCIVCLLVFCSIQFFSPTKMRGLILRRKTGTVSVEIFAFHVHLAFERHPGTEWRELSSRAAYKEFLCLSSWFFWKQCNKMYKLTSKRPLFCFYLPCSEDSEKGSCSDKQN